MSRLVALKDTPLLDGHGNLLYDIEYVTVEEGGAWLRYDSFDRSRKIHSARQYNGREWDALNGWRDNDPMEAMG